VNGPTDNFCSACGTSLSGVTDETTLVYDLPDDTEALPPPNAASGAPDTEAGVLEVLSGPKRGSRFSLVDSVTTAGRHPDSVIFLDDVTVSRRHATIERQDNGYVMRDAGSLNGTYLNRERVDEAALSHGDELQIGKFKLVFAAPGHTGA
jgi:pSer/pThr/pTyr-binding forkhead associated (FHA) protein